MYLQCSKRQNMNDSSLMCCISSPKQQKTESKIISEVEGNRRQLTERSMLPLPQVHKVPSLQEINLTTWKWDKIPTDVLLQIFSHLSLYDLGRAAQVCSHWYQVAQYPQLWQRIEFILSHPSRSNVRPTPDGLIDYILKYHVQDLQFVIFKTDSSVESAETVCQILSRLVDCSLKTLALISSARPVFLDMDQQSFVSALTVVFDHSQALSSLAIDNTPVDDPSLEALASNSSRTLELLRMKSCPRVSPGGVLALADNCRCLRELSLSYSLLSDDLLLALSSEKHVTLEHLRVDVYSAGEGDVAHRISPQCWQALIRHSPRMNLVMYFFRVPDECLISLFSSYVPATNLYFGDYVPQSVMIKIAGHCPRLQELVVAGGHYVDSELILVATGCPHLSSVGLGDCEVSCSTLVEFVRICGARLKELYVMEEGLVEDINFDVARTCEIVSKILGRAWSPEFTPLW